VKNHYEILDNGLTMIQCKRFNRLASVPILTKDLDRVKEFPNTWSLQWDADSRTYYVRGVLDKKKVFLHAWIMNPDPGMVVDHINHIGTDNRRVNLKVCTNAENGKNSLSSVIFDQGLGLHGAIIFNSKDGIGNLYWGVAHFMDINLGRFKEEAEAFFVQAIAREVYEGATDEQMLRYIVQMGHKAEDVQRIINKVRKLFKMPDPSTDQKRNEGRKLSCIER
jgi:hypothetical protein